MKLMKSHTLHEHRLKREHRDRGKRGLPPRNQGMQLAKLNSVHILEAISAVMRAMSSWGRAGVDQRALNVPKSAANQAWQS